MSLRARLLVATTLVALTALAVAGVATYTSFTHSQLKQIDDTLQRTHEPIEQLVGADPTDLTRQIEQVAPGTYVAVQSSTGELEVTIPAREPGHAELDLDLDDIPAPTDDGGGFFDVPTFLTVDATTSGQQLRVRTSRLDDGRILIIGESLHDVSQSARRLLITEIIVAAIALLAAGVVGWVLVRIGLRPLREVERTALQIAAGGDIEQRVPGAGKPTEVGRLATALNTMLDRIRSAFTARDETERELRDSEDRMRRLVADVSHELRTPLAAVSAYTELFERGARDHPADLERAMRGINIEAARMRELVEELLLLARLDEGRPLARGRVDISEVVVEAIAASRAVAPDWPITLKVSDVVLVEGDAGKLRQVLDNLLVNVRTHTPRGTSAAIEVSTVDEQVVITLADTGPGMTSSQATHLFERFYRADPSRSRSSGGAGLGMAIVKAIIEAHHGDIEVSTGPGDGFRVTVSLPRFPTPQLQEARR